MNNKSWKVCWRHYFW